MNAEKQIFWAGSGAKQKAHTHTPGDRTRVSKPFSDCPCQSQVSLFCSVSCLCVVPWGRWVGEEADFLASEAGHAAFFLRPFVCWPLCSPPFVVFRADFDPVFKDKQVPALRAPSGVPARRSRQWPAAITAVSRGARPRDGAAGATCGIWREDSRQPAWQAQSLKP